MSQFGSGMNDAIVTDGDKSFMGVNQRLQINELQPGEVRESINGRMEGYWKPRKSVASKTGALTTASKPLKLPFYLMNSAKTISGATASAGVISITVTSHGFEAGSSGWAKITGLDAAVNGSYELTYVDANTLQYTVPGVTSVSDVNGFLSQMPIDDFASANVRASCLFSDPNQSNKEFVIVALDTVAKKIDLDGYTVTDIAYPIGQALGEDTDMIQVFDKVMLFRDGKQAFEWYPNGRPVFAASQSGTTTVTMSVKNHGLTSGAAIVIAGLTGGTPSNGTFTVASVINADTFTYVSGTSQTVVFGVAEATMTDGFTLSPGGTYTQPQVFDAHGGRVSVDGGLVTITVDGNVTVSAGDVIIVYENTIPELAPLVGKEFQVTSATTTQIQFYAPAPSIILREITAATQASSIVKLFTDTDHGIPIGDTINVNAVTYTTGTDPNGLFQTIRQAANITSAVIAGSTITITSAGHGFVTSDLVTIDGIVFASGTTPNGVFTITRIDANQFSYTLTGGVGPYTTTSAFATKDDINKRLLYNLAGAAGLYEVVNAYVTTATGAANQQIEIGGRFSVGGGFMHQPGAPWGIHFQRRLWVPYYYDGAGTFNLPTYTTRKITDEIAVSDILDTTTFDRIANQFRVSGGTADYVVAMHGFYEDQLVVLNRNSLHLISGTIGSLSDTKVTELTSEVGCLARKSVVMKGNVMLFLSDDGVYGVEFLNDYNLRGVDEPLSKNIQPYIDRLNKNFSDKSVAVLHENRYYLAVPLDSSPGANDSYGNNAILVFNFLNKGWESLDTFGDSRFLIEDFVIGSAGVRNNIYAVTSNGGLHQLEAFESSNDTLNVDNSASIVSPSITASLTTRGYDFETLERKRFTDAQVNMQTIAGQSGEYGISFAAEDPDAAQLIGTTTTFLGGLLTPSTPNEAETASIRCRLGGIRGSTGTMILTRTIGSPKINSVTVSGSVTNRQIISQR